MTPRDVVRLTTSFGVACAAVSGCLSIMAWLLLHPLAILIGIVAGLLSVVWWFMYRVLYGEEFE